MANKILILYDLKGKTSAEKTAIQRKLYNYLDKSNYEYSYKRKGLLNKLILKKTKKIVLELKSKKDLPKLISLFNELHIEAEIART